MNIFRLLGDISHLVSILILLHKMKTSSSASGISFKSQFLYLIVYVTRYLDLFWTNPTHNLYNTFFKLAYISSSGYTIYLMLNDYKPTHDPNLDTFKVQYLLGGSAVMAILLPYRYTPSEILWAFSIWLESVAILPQLFMLQRTGEAETITTHYLFALGIYRALYIPNWIYRYFSEGYVDLLAVVAGIIQTVLYSDFFYIYYTKCVLPTILGRSDEEEEQEAEKHPGDDDTVVMDEKAVLESIVVVPESPETATKQPLSSEKSEQ